MPSPQAEQHRSALFSRSALSDVSEFCALDKGYPFSQQLQIYRYLLIVHSDTRDTLLSIVRVRDLY